MSEREIAENTAAGQDVGAAVTATDADAGDTLSYTLGGADMASFDFVETTGQIRTKAGVSYDFEAKASYTVTVTATDNSNATAVAERHHQHQRRGRAPQRAGDAHGLGSLRQYHQPVGQLGRPGQRRQARHRQLRRAVPRGQLRDLERRPGGRRGHDHDHCQPRREHRSMRRGCAPPTPRATPAGPSRPGPAGPTRRATMRRCSVPANVSREIAENTAAGQDVGAAVTATDADAGDTLSYTLGGADVAAFDFVETTGQIRTKAGVSYDFEAKASYTVTVTATDNSNATAVADVTISISDVDEPPSAPATPMVSAVSGSTTSLSVSWAAPANAGKPAIASYDVQYRVGQLRDLERWPGGRRGHVHDHCQPRREHRLRGAGARLQRRGRLRLVRAARVPAGPTRRATMRRCSVPRTCPAKSRRTPPRARTSAPR